MYEKIIIKKFRKKPVVVRAVRFDGTNEAEVQDLTGPQNFCMVDLEDRYDDPECVGSVYDKLHSTWVGVKAGQWVIESVKGEFYPCDPEVLAETYERVE